MQIEQIDTEVIHDAGTSAPIEKFTRRMPVLSGFDWKKQAAKIPLSDWLIFGGAGVCLLTLALSAGKPAPQIAKKTEAQFNPQLLEEYAQADTKEFFSNFDAFLRDQDEVLLAQRSIEYRDEAKNFKNDKKNDSCYGFKTADECGASFLFNRAGELEQLIESPNSHILVRVNKTEARMLNNFRVRANLSSVLSSDFPDVAASDNAMLLQTRMAGKHIQARAGASAEGVARQQLIQEEPF